MPARTGQAYLQGLQEQPREIWLHGERIADVTTHPALRNGATRSPVVGEVYVMSSP